ncbi:alpha/beta hydrolase [Chelatococcus asaccharovorans]|uniref:alpha/beta hydrolase n=1 Tax=Chelatococcus asaccharovorans TaxID=28210 RepID=UPI00224C7264|nr:alpha/beta hydrolase [Chelatococcus asaccharovorans]CAH1663362.1 Arylformamidase [Chelatococcus asaccharovorans]CAH1682861.1 Arylformamidase [Chelatococcus asaccharovorans]
MTAGIGVQDRDWYEREYNPRVAVPELPDILAAWVERSKATHARHPPLADIVYGGHPREVFDLFRAPQARGTVVFIHGGYWRALSKFETSWVADAFLAQGLSVALLNYPLCPDVTLAHIRESALAAFTKLYRNVLNDAERRSVVVTGHSAGGYLAALHLMTDWTARGLPQKPIAGIVSISGVFELLPLLHTSMNEALRLDAAEAERLTLLGQPWVTPAKAAFAVGGLEPDAFHRQSREMAAGWADLAPRGFAVPDTNHFTVLEGLAVPGSALNAAVIEMVG